MMQLQEIRNHVRREEWVLPPFQREYVWDEESRIKEFLESVFHKWPVGSIILWRPSPKEEDVFKRRMYTKTDGGPLYPQEHVIDGQQRITTLLRALNNEPFVFRGREKKACFNFSSKHFVFEEESDLPENVVLMRDVMELSFPEIRAKLKMEELEYDVDNLIAEIRRMSEYEVIVQRTPEDTLLKDALELFIRLNTGGKQLPSVDLALAYISLLWEESRDEFKAFKEALKPMGFDFDVDFFVRCLCAVSLKQSLTKKLIRSIDVKSIKDDWEETRNGIEKTIDFLKTTLNLSSNIFLEAENTLVPIVVSFSKREAETIERMNSLAFWFVVSYLNQRFSGQSTAVLNRDINKILEKSGNPVEGLLKNLKEEKVHGYDSDLKPDQIKGNHFKFILYCLYRDIKTKDFVSGFGIEVLPASSMNKLDFHHIFADSILKKTEFKDEKDDIANKTFLTNKSNKKLSDSDPTYLSLYPKELLEAHLIPTKEVLWKLEEYEQFLEERRTLVSDALNNFLNRLKGE